MEGLSRTRNSHVASFARLDRDAHRTTGGQAAVVPDHNLLCNYCIGSPPQFYFNDATHDQQIGMLRILIIDSPRNMLVSNVLSQ